MSCEIRTENGKLFGFTDCEDPKDEFVVVNNKKISLHDIYQDEKLFKDFNDEIKNSYQEATDVL